LMLTLVERSK